MALSTLACWAAAAANVNNTKRASLLTRTMTGNSRCKYLRSDESLQSCGIAEPVYTEFSAGNQTKIPIWDANIQKCNHTCFCHFDSIPNDSKPICGRHWPKRGHLIST